jgi:HEPN domain-containing protein
MSLTKNRNQADRWLRTAGQDLRSAEILTEAGQYANACFLAQQAAEKAVKALCYAAGLDPWGHSVQHLCEMGPLTTVFAPRDEWAQKAAELDRLYVPTRYPNGLPDLTPGETFFESDARQALRLAQEFLGVATHALGSV